MRRSHLTLAWGHPGLALVRLFECGLITVLKGEPEPLARNVACLDYSVAKEGKLVAYRWQGESVLAKENFTHAMSRG